MNGRLGGGEGVRGGESVGRGEIAVAEIVQDRLLDPDFLDLPGDFEMGLSRNGIALAARDLGQGQVPVPLIIGVSDPE